MVGPGLRENMERGEYSNNMTNVIPSVGVLIIRNGNVLLVRHGEAAGHMNGAYGIPAGRLDEGETLVDAAIRELREETGLVVDAADLVLMPKEWRALIQRKDGAKEFSVRVFMCSHYEGEIQASPEGTPEWIAIKEIDALPLLPNMKEIILEGVSQIRSMGKFE